MQPITYTRARAAYARIHTHARSHTHTHTQTRAHACMPVQSQHNCPACTRTRQRPHANGMRSQVCIHTMALGETEVHARAYSSMYRANGNAQVRVGTVTQAPVHHVAYAHTHARSCACSTCTQFVRAEQGMATVAKYHVGHGTHFVCSPVAIQAPITTIRKRAAHASLSPRAHLFAC